MTIDDRLVEKVMIEDCRRDEVRGGVYLDRGEGGRWEGTSGEIHKATSLSVGER